MCVRGFNQVIADPDETFASTLVIMVLKHMLIMALAFVWSIHTFDITAALLHAMLGPSDMMHIQLPK